MNARPSGFSGTWLLACEQGFEETVLDGNWNKLIPDRRPDAIGVVDSVDDVVIAVKAARRNGWRVSIRGGGHNWVSSGLRNGGLLIDLSRLNKVVSIDPANMSAVTDPIVSNREMFEHLAPLGLAFPTGHCPEVKVSGYLLSGGMSWNHGVWGSGCGSVEAIEMVTADGRLVTASATENPDLFWAARGAGPAQFAVAVRYHLRLSPLPKNIVGSAYYYRVEHAPTIGAWLHDLADRLPPMVELSLFVVEAPPTLNVEGKVAMVTASIFADSPEEALAAASPLEDCPVREHCLLRSFAQPAGMTNLFDLSGGLWPPGLRSRVDAMFSNDNLGELMVAVRDHLPAMSPETVFMFAIYTGGSAPATPSDAAYSLTAKLYGGPWTMWRDEADDHANNVWHDECVGRLAPYVCGHYIGESNTTGHPEFIEGAFGPGVPERLRQVRDRYDPHRLFYEPHEGLR